MAVVGWRILLASSLAVGGCSLKKDGDAGNVSQCKARPNEAYVTAVVQDMANRPPNATELAWAKDPAFTPQTFMDKALASGLYDDAATKFLSNLFRLSSLTPQGSDDEEKLLVNDLQQEPIALVLHNKDKPWSFFFQTRDVYCTQRTAALYGSPASTIAGFTSCQLPDERAGFLGLVSVLRMSSPDSNPQAFYLPNNNYHRARAALYFSTGVKMESAANGPAGDTKGLPMADCVPTSDVRKTSEGLVFGTAAIPQVGASCAACHSRHMAPLSVAFRKFGPTGSVLTKEALERVDEAKAGAPQGELAAILNENNSCWAAQDGMAPTYFKGLAGLGQVIAENADLGTALGRQLPEHLANFEAEEALVKTIKASFDANGKTLAAALRGFFTADRYTCE